jgi:DNA processing protein
MKQIIDAEGCVITEYLHDMMPERGNFPARNRLVAGLSDAVVVVETAVSGGSMITATMAFHYNRDVFAVPGKTTDVYHAGCHQLIKTHKAALIESAADLLEQMNWKTSPVSQASAQLPLFPELGESSRRLIQFLRAQTGIGLDAICFEMNLSHSEASMLLLELELLGMVKASPGKIYSVC